MPIGRNHFLLEENRILDREKIRKLNGLAAKGLPIVMARVR